MTDQRKAPDDPIEAELAAGATILHREKVVGRKLALICLLLALFMGAASIAYAMGWGANVSTLAKVITYLMAPFALFTAVARTVLRAVVTAKEVHLSRGLSGRRIQLQSITSLRAGPMNQISGYEVFAPEGKEAVFIEWLDETGKARKAAVASHDPPALLAAIERARASVRKPASALRVKNDIDVDAEALAEAETAAAADVTNQRA